MERGIKLPSLLAVQQGIYHQSFLTSPQQTINGLQWRPAASNASIQVQTDRLAGGTDTCLETKFQSGSFVQKVTSES